MGIIHYTSLLGALSSTSMLIVLFWKVDSRTASFQPI